MVPELEESELPSAEDVSLPVASLAVTLFHFPDQPFLEWFLVLLGVEPRAVSLLGRRSVTELRKPIIFPQCTGPR